MSDSFKVRESSSVQYDNRKEQDSVSINVYGLDNINFIDDTSTTQNFSVTDAQLTHNSEVILHVRQNDAYIWGLNDTFKVYNVNQQPRYDNKFKILSLSVETIEGENLPETASCEL